MAKPLGSSIYNCTCLCRLVQMENWTWRVGKSPSQTDRFMGGFQFRKPGYFPAYLFLTLSVLWITSCCVYLSFITITISQEREPLILSGQRFLLNCQAWVLVITAEPEPKTRGRTKQPYWSLRDRVIAKNYWTRDSMETNINLSWYAFDKAEKLDWDLRGKIDTTH